MPTDETTATERLVRSRQIIETVEAEFRVGGRPVRTYEDLDATDQLTEAEGIRLTVAIVLNLEERIVALEELHLGLLEAKRGGIL